MCGWWYRIIVECHGLSWTIMDYHGLSWMTIHELGILVGPTVDQWWRTSNITWWRIPRLEFAVFRWPTGYSYWILGWKGLVNHCWHILTYGCIHSLWKKNDIYITLYNYLDVHPKWVRVHMKCSRKCRNLIRWVRFTPAAIWVTNHLRFLAN